MYCFILLFNLFISSTTGFTVTGSGTFNSRQRATHNAWDIFHSFGYIYDDLHINSKKQKYDFFEKSKKIWFK